MLGVVQPSSLRAQELEPRSYWPAPVGTSGLMLGATSSRGDFVADPSFPVEDIHSTTNTLQTGYFQVFSFFGRNASVTVTLPYGRFKAGFGSATASIERIGAVDPLLRFTVNLKGAAALTPQEFQEFRQNPTTVVGTSLRIKTPLGEYDPTTTANLGTNRWAFKPELGIVHPFLEKWAVEVTLGSWLFTDNHDFLGRTLSQAPIASAEVHLVRRVRPGLWASFDSNFFYGGRTETGVKEFRNLQSNGRIGGTVSIPFQRSQALKVAVSTGIFTRFGGDYKTVLVGYQYFWLHGAPGGAPESPP